MELFELKKQIKEKKLKPLYVFTGEEVAIMDIYIEQISKVTKTKVKRVDSIGEIYSKLQNNSFINQASCYIIRDDKDYLTQEKIWGGMDMGAVQGDNTIILVYTTLDKRNKFYKQHGQSMITFDFLSPDVLHKYIYKEINLEEHFGRELAILCDCNYSRILLECDKIKHLANALKIDHQSAYLMAIKEKIIYTSPKDVIFELIDAICKREVTHSFELFYELTKYKDNTLAIISLLYTNIKSLLLVHSAGQCKSITDRTGLTAWQVKLAKEKGNHYSIGELVRALRLIREAEKGIKTGMIESGMAVEYILANIL